MIHPPIRENGERLVSLSQLVNSIQVYSYYYEQGYKGALPDCYVREGVASRLVIAADSLPTDHSLVILDGWRPIQLQETIYHQWKQTLLDQGWEDGEALSKELTKYVAKPTLDPKKPPRHLTGGAVDLTIAGPNGWLDMGTAFDDFSERAQTAYFERLTPADTTHQQIQQNRRMLYSLMSRAGFTNYAEEWWHYDYGNQAWAQSLGHPEAIYGGIQR